MPRYSRKRLVRVSKTFRKKVKKVIQATAEKKIIPTLLFDNFYYGLSEKSFGGSQANIANTVGPQPLLTNLMGIGNGNTAISKIGDSIMLKSLVLKGYFYHQLAGIAPVGGIYNQPVITTMYIVSAKAFPQSISLNASFPPNVGQGTSGAANFLRDSDVVQPFYGSLLDMDVPVNHEQYTVHHKQIFRTGPQGMDSADVFNYSNGRYRNSTHFSVNLARFLPKVIKFNDSYTVMSPANQLNAHQLFLILTHQNEFSKVCYSTDLQFAPLANTSLIIPPKMSYRVYGSFTDT